MEATTTDTPTNGTTENAHPIAAELHSRAVHHAAKRAESEADHA